MLDRDGRARAARLQRLDRGGGVGLDLAQPFQRARDAAGPFGAEPLAPADPGLHGREHLVGETVGHDRGGARGSGRAIGGVGDLALRRAVLDDQGGTGFLVGRPRELRGDAQAGDRVRACRLQRAAIGDGLAAQRVVQHRALAGGRRVQAEADDAEDGLGPGLRWVQAGSLDAPPFGPRVGSRSRGIGAGLIRLRPNQTSSGVVGSRASGA
ncbi:hypothetical protein [Elioraea tepidiphila]|uniref:hypothetical protein n=1 Tax=Elioraea tepidiphila TaxID=457934 RepID=UPI002FDA1D17